MPVAGPSRILHVGPCRAAEMAATGVDFLAVGALTHSAPVLDIGLDIAGTG